MPTGYAAYEIDDASREKLLAAFVPRYPDVIAHHITHKYGATESDVPPQPQQVTVVGHHDSGAVQVLVVQVDGQKHQVTQDDGGEKFYHITLSLDREQGVSSRNSNDVLQTIRAEKGEGALYNLSAPFEISVTPKFLVDEDSPGPQAHTG